MQVTQVYFNDTNAPPPDPIVECVGTVKRYIHDLPHVLYNLETARCFLEQHMCNDVVTAFDKLKPYAYKADLFRYCVLYSIGGWYFDATVRVNTAVLIPDTCNSVAFRDFPVVTNTASAVSNGALFARPGHKVYETAIKTVLNNCKAEYYGTCNLSPTGPVLLGRAFSLVGDDVGGVFFNSIMLTPGYHRKNPALVLSDGVIFAFLKNTGQTGLSGFQTTGTNNYAELYSLRDIYKLEV